MPAGYVEKDERGVPMICCVQKPIYGVPQAGRRLQRCLFDWMLDKNKANLRQLDVHGGRGRGPDWQLAGALGERQPEKLAQLVVREVLVVLAVLHRRAVHEDARLERSSCMWRLALRETPGRHVLVVGAPGVLVAEIADLLREREAERREPLDQPREVLLVQRLQMVRAAQASPDSVTL